MAVDAQSILEPSTNQKSIVCIGVSTPAPSKTPPLFFAKPPLNLQTVHTPFQGFPYWGGVPPLAENYNFH